MSGDCQVSSWLDSAIQSLASARPEFGSYETSRREPCEVHELDVIAPQLDRRLQGKPADIRQIGKNLNVG
jgi:hypothetical protein